MTMPLRFIFNQIEANYVFASDKLYMIPKDELWNLKIERITDEIGRQEMELKAKWDFYEEQVRLAKMMEIDPPKPINEEMPEVKTMRAHLYELLETERDMQEKKYDEQRWKWTAHPRGTVPSIDSIDDGFFYVDALAANNRAPIAYFYPTPYEDLKNENWNPILEVLLHVHPPTIKYFKPILDRGINTLKTHRVIKVFDDVFKEQAHNYFQGHLFSLK